MLGGVVFLSRRLVGGDDGGGLMCRVVASWVPSQEAGLAAPACDPGLVFVAVGVGVLGFRLLLGRGGRSAKVS